MDLFATAETLPLPDCQIDYDPQFLPPQQADDYLHALCDKVDWRQESITLYGKSVAQPRLSAWYGDADSIYSYSGLTLHPHIWLAELVQLRHQLEQYTGYRFNSVLLNYYRNGQDSMGWHSDNEPELGPEPVIASISLGAERRFRLQHKRSKQIYAIDLQHGSLLLMQGDTQRFWRHQVPKTKLAIEARINLTFRHIL